MITEDYCSFEVAKLLKKKGFITPCDWLYCSDGTFGHRNSLWDKEMFPAPTHQMAMKWLREKQIYIRIIEDTFGKSFRFEVYSKNPNVIVNYYIPNYYIDTYEDTVEAALKYCLENLI